MAGVSKQKDDRKVEKKVAFPRMKGLIASLAIASSVAAVQACGSEDEQPPSLGNGNTGAAGASGASGTVSSGGASGSTAVGGSSGSETDAGATTCHIVADRNLDCDSTTSVSETLSVGDRMKVGVEDGVVSLRFAGAVGSDFQTAEWDVLDTDCESTTERVDEGSSRVVRVGNNEVEVTVHEIAPDTANGGTMVTATFSAVCGDRPEVDGGGTGEGVCEGVVSEEGQDTTLDVGSGVTVGNVTFELVSSSVESAVVRISCTMEGNVEQVEEVTVEAGSTVTHDLGDHQAQIENIWSNPVQAKIRPSVNTN